MSKRHNRKRTRSRPRHRDSGKARSFHDRTSSVDTNYSYTSSLQPPPIPPAYQPPDHWHQTYSAWQARHRQQQKQQQQQEQAREMEWLRFFGGEAGDEISLLEPMLKVVTDLFDGNTDYEDP